MFVTWDENEQLPFSINTISLCHKPIIAKEYDLLEDPILYKSA
jgi:hypothetical protein